MLKFFKTGTLILTALLTNHWWLDLAAASVKHLELASEVTDHAPFTLHDELDSTPAAPVAELERALLAGVRQQLVSRDLDQPANASQVAFDGKFGVSVAAVPAAEDNFAITDWSDSLSMFDAGTDAMDDLMPSEAATAASVASIPSAPTASLARTMCDFAMQVTPADLKLGIVGNASSLQRRKAVVQTGSWYIPDTAKSRFATPVPLRPARARADTLDQELLSLTASKPPRYPQAIHDRGIMGRALTAAATQSAASTVISRLQRRKILSVALDQVAAETPDN